MNPNDNQYQELQNEFVEKLQKDKFAHQIITFNNRKKISGTSSTKPETH